MSHQSTTNIPSSLEGPLGSNEITNHISCPAQQLPGESSTLVPQPSVSNSELLDTEEQQNHSRNNELENTQLNSASYGADHEHVSKPPVSSSPPFTAEDVNQDGQEPVGNKAEIPPATEEALRSQAIAWMEATYSGIPNGGVVQPPSWYTYSRTEHPDRPRVWMKDFFTGHVRPRRLVNDRLASMSRAERERWANQQRRMRGEPAE